MEGEVDFCSPKSKLFTFQLICLLTPNNPHYLLQILIPTFLICGNRTNFGILITMMNFGITANALWSHYTMFGI